MNALFAHRFSKHYCACCLVFVTLASFQVVGLDRSIVGAAEPLVHRDVPRAPPSSDREAGRRLYQVYCWQCHGTKGRGDGPIAAQLSSPPRDLTQAHYRIRSTSGNAPASGRDLLLTIRRGLPATHMPGWHTLPDRELLALVRYVQSLAGRLTEERSQAVSPVANVLPSDDAIHLEQGRRIFLEAKCWLCHGNEGTGDGPLAAALVRHGRMRVGARDLRLASAYKAGSTTADIYRTVTTGFFDTPMGAYDPILSYTDRVSAARYVASLVDQNVARESLVESGVSWQRGRWVFFGKGRCVLCHNVERKGDASRGPDLSEVGLVASTRRDGQTAVDYLYESIVTPNVYLVPGYGRQMPKVNQEAVFLETDEIRSLVVYLAAQGKGVRPNRRQFATMPQSDPLHPTTLRLAHPTSGTSGANHGWDVFRSDEAACLKCHSLHGHGNPVGPDITNVSSYLSGRQIQESLEKPNDVITFGYQEVAVMTVDGRVQSGVPVQDGDDALHLVDGQGNRIIVPKEKIEETLIRDTSNMPTGIVEQLGEDNYADLLAFLLDQQPAMHSPPTRMPAPVYDNPRARRKMGPPLKNVMHKVGPVWLEQWLRNPERHDRETYMPNLKLEREEIEAITAYLSSIANRQFPQQDWASSMRKPLDDLTGVEWDQLDELIEQGKAVWSQARCSICHRVGETGGVIGHAPALTNAAMKLRRDWVYQWLENPRSHFPRTHMPRYRTTHQQRRQLTAYLLKGDACGGLDVKGSPDDPPRQQRPDAALVQRGREIIRKSRCVVCHEIPGIQELLAVERDIPRPQNDSETLIQDARCLTCHTIAGQGGTFAPDLTTVGSRLRPSWIKQYLLAPDVVRPLLKQMPRLFLSEREADLFAQYAKTHLTAPSIAGGQEQHATASKQDIEHGRRLYAESGCVACHQIGRNGGAVGPTLTGVAERLEPAYLFQHIKNPQRLNPTLVEPNYGFTNQQVRQLVEYLLSSNTQDAEEP
ncbi:MAG: c-type cytochrome [Pirellulaceae bacterium]